MIIGNVSVMSIPPTVGVAADLTVQAPVEVAADGMFPNGSTARGFAAGTSVVPVGYLSGETDPTTTVTLIDAKATLAAPATTPLSSSRSTPPAPQRPRAPG